MAGEHLIPFPNPDHDGNVGYMELVDMGDGGWALRVTGIAGGSGGGGSGDASASNQVQMITRLTTLINQTDTLEPSLITLLAQTDNLETLLANLITATDLGNTRNAKPSGATLANIASSLTANGVTAFPANAGRKGASMYNDSTSVCLIAFAATVSATAFTVKLQPDAYYEVPHGYTGVISALWVGSANGSLRTTELS
jgi:hypothetical protein